jgi:hypothetical protein
MNHRQCEKERRRLVTILNEYKGTEKTQQRVEALQDLARDIGASTGRRRSGEDIDQVGLVDNIHTALQTMTMIDMCKTASRNFIIALFATGAALLSALAACIAVCR